MIRETEGQTATREGVRSEFAPENNSPSNKRANASPSDPAPCSRPPRPATVPVDECVFTGLHRHRQRARLPPVGSGRFSDGSQSHL